MSEDRRHYLYPDKQETAAVEALRYEFEVWAARHFGVPDANKTCWAGYRWNTYLGGAYFAHDLETAWLAWKKATALALAAVQSEVQSTLAALAQKFEPSRLSDAQCVALNLRVPGDLGEVDEAGVGRGSVTKAAPAQKVLGVDGYCVGCDCLDRGLDACVWAASSQLVKNAVVK